MITLNDSEPSPHVCVNPNLMLRLLMNTKVIWHLSRKSRKRTDKTDPGTANCRAQGPCNISRPCLPVNLAIYLSAFTEPVKNRYYFKIYSQCCGPDRLGPTPTYLTRKDSSFSSFAVGIVKYHNRNAQVSVINIRGHTLVTFLAGAKNIPTEI